MAESVLSKKQSKSKESEWDDLLQTFKDWHRSAQKHQKDWRDEAIESYDFVAGRQWESEDLALLSELNRPVVTFNRMTPLVDSVSGTEINNRQEVRYIPRKMGGVQVNEVLTGAAKWVRDECDAEFEESHAFMDVVICGMGWTETRLETDEEPSGKVEIPRVDPLEMVWDPSARKRNLSDRRWQLRIRDVDKKDAETMFPDEDPGDLHAAWAMEVIGDEPHDATEAKEYKNDQGDVRPKPDKKVRLVEAQWWEHEAYYLVIDPFTQEKKQFNVKDYSTLVKRVKKINKEQNASFEVDSVKMRHKVYKRAFIGAKVLEVEISPGGNDFTYKCITGKLDRNKGVWYGIVRALKDPQRWANKWLSTTMYIMNSNAKGGLLAESDAFVNPKKAEEDWADPASIIWLKQGGLAKIKEREVFNFPLGFDKLMNFAIASIPDVSGINLNFMALTQGDEAAVLDRQRKQTALTILAGLFDNLRRYRREQGRLLLYYIITYISDGRLVRITEDENIKYIPLIHTEGLQEYDVIVDDNPTSPNQKEKTWSILMQLMPMLGQIPIPPSVWMQILRQSPLPSTFVEGLQKLVSQPPQQSPAQKAQLQKLVAQAEKDMSIAAKNMAEAGQKSDQGLIELMKTMVSMVKIMTEPEQQGQLQRQPQQQLQQLSTIGGVQ